MQRILLLTNRLKTKKNGGTEYEMLFYRAFYKPLVESIVMKGVTNTFTYIITTSDIQGVPQPVTLLSTTTDLSERLDCFQTADDQGARFSLAKSLSSSHGE